MGAETDSYSTFTSGGTALRSAPLVTLIKAEPARKPVAPSRPTTSTAGAHPTASPIKAVLFDAEDVLYDASAWYRWLTQVFARIEPRNLEADFAQQWQEEFLPAVHRGQEEFFAAFTRCLTTIGLAAGHVEEVVAAARAQRRRQEASMRPLPGVRSTLSHLRAAGIVLGILAGTDRSATALGRDVSRLGLEGSFDHTCTSIDLRINLADDRCYGRTLSKLRLVAAETLFVGHEARDLRGAQSAGLWTVAFNARQGVSGVMHINRFDELLELVVPASVSTSTALSES